jgi:hypothetical protein
MRLGHQLFVAGAKWAARDVSKENSQSGCEAIA